MTNGCRVQGVEVLLLLLPPARLCCAALLLLRWPVAVAAVAVVAVQCWCAAL
jgi:hypothetical protein